MTQHPTSLARRLLVGATLAVVALTGTSCADGDDGGTASDPAPAASSSTVPAASGEPAPAASEKPAGSTESNPPASVPEALDFEASTVAGAGFSGATVAGKPVVLWFWAPWCAVCRGQAPEVTRLAEEYADEVSFIGVGSLDSGDAIAEFAEEFPAVTHLSDPDGELWQRFDIAEQSSFVVLDAEGGEALRTGYADDDELADTVADVAGS